MGGSQRSSARAPSKVSLAYLAGFRSPKSPASRLPAVVPPALRLPCQPVQPRNQCASSPSVWPWLRVRPCPLSFSAPTPPGHPSFPACHSLYLSSPSPSASPHLSSAIPPPDDTPFDHPSARPTFRHRPFALRDDSRPVRPLSSSAPYTMNSQGANDVSPEAMQARIQQARREAETLKDRIKRKKDELSDTTRTFVQLTHLGCCSRIGEPRCSHDHGAVEIARACATTELQFTAFTPTQLEASDANLEGHFDPCACSESRRPAGSSAYPQKSAHEG